MDHPHASLDSVVEVGTIRQKGSIVELVASLSSLVLLELQPRGRSSLVVAGGSAPPPQVSRSRHAVPCAYRPHRLERRDFRCAPSDAGTVRSSHLALTYQAEIAAATECVMYRSMFHVPQLVPLSWVQSSCGIVICFWRFHPPPVHLRGSLGLLQLLLRLQKHAAFCAANDIAKAAGERRLKCP